MSLRWKKKNIIIHSNSSYYLFKNKSKKISLDYFISKLFFNAKYLFFLNDNKHKIINDILKC